MVFRFGWQKFWNKKEFYENHPYFSEDAASYLVANGVELVGYDTPSPDGSKKRDDGIDSPIHKIFLKNEVVLLEYLANLDELKNLEGWKIVVAPMKIEGLPLRFYYFQSHSETGDNRIALSYCYQRGAILENGLLQC
mgnify:CR=1 FL=1